MDKSKRLKELRNSIINNLPKFPNNKDTKDKLGKMSMATLLIHYLSWISRYVSAKPRVITIESFAKIDPRWLILQSQIKSFLSKVKAGEELTPHLSLQTHSRGYTPEAAQTGPGVDRWADKDFLLNAMGYHHFHLGTEIEPQGHASRTNEVLFAKVSREEFTVVGIFNHAVFDRGGQEMTDERKRLWAIFNNHVTRGLPPGSVVMAPPIALSGHPIHVVRTADEYSRVIYKVEPMLDDMSFIADMYRDSGVDVPAKPKFEWALNYSDLGIFETRNRHLFVLRRGFN